MKNIDKFKDIIENIEKIILNSVIWSDWYNTDAIIDSLFENGLNISDETLEVLQDENIEIFDLYLEAKEKTCSNFKYQLKFSFDDEIDIHYSNDKKILIDKVYSFYCQSNESLTKKEVAEMIN